MHPWCVAWPGAYTVSNKYPAPEEFGHMRLDSLCTYTAVHIRMHVVAMHEYKTTMMVLIVSVQQFTVLPM